MQKRRRKENGLSTTWKKENIFLLYFHNLFSFILESSKEIPRIISCRQLNYKTSMQRMKMKNTLDNSCDARVHFIGDALQKCILQKKIIRINVWQMLKMKFAVHPSPLLEKNRMFELSLDVIHEHGIHVKWKH